ncbi:unnamed protein product, partial [Discosporangium mesarthrocarpum]
MLFDFSHFRWGPTELTGCIPNTWYQLPTAKIVRGLAPRFCVLLKKKNSALVLKECWLAYQETTAPRCLHCEAPVAHLPGRFGGKFVKVDEPPGRVHSECWDAFRGSRPADPEPATPAAETCGHCKERIAVVRDKFSGRFFELEGGIKIHAECRTAYHEANTPKCQQCSAPIAPEGGRFSGGFYELMGEHEGARVHTECYGSWLEAVAPRCLSCGEAVRRKEGKFSGDFCFFDAGKTHK